MNAIHISKNIFFILMVSLLVLSACSNEDDPFAGTDSYITSFSLQQGETVFNAEITERVITIKVPEGVSLKGATATVELSENASIYPDPAGITDWDEEMLFAVTAYDGMTQLSYKYSVNRAQIDADETVILPTQADVDAFGASGITAIGGSLIIGSVTGTDSIRDLGPLAKLKEINYSLTIHPTFAATELSGFDALEKVGGDIYSTAANMEKVSFPKLQSAGSIFFKNSMLGEVVFSRLENVSKSITLQCPLGGISFPNLKQAKSIHLEDRDAMITSVAFPSLEKAESIIVYFLPSLTKILLPELKEVGDITLNWLTVLAFVDAPKLEVSTGTISLPDVSKLSELSFPEMRKANEISIKGAEVGLLHFPKLEVITNLTIQNTTLSGISNGFDKLEKIEGELRLMEMPEMKTLSIPSSIKRIEKLTIYNQNVDRNFAEINIKGMNLGELSVERDAVNGIKIIGDDVFHGTLSFDTQNGRTYDWVSPVFEGFREIDSISYGIYISNLRNLEMKGIRKIEKGFHIPNNNLTALSLPDLEEVGGNFVINHLSSVSVEDSVFVIPKLKSVGGDFRITTASAGINALELPLLESISGDFIIGTGYASTSPWDPNGRDMKSLSFPALKTIGGKITLKPYLEGGDNYINERLTDLGGFLALESVKGVEIVRHQGLVSYVGLKKAISSFPATAWNIRDNGYNPTYQDLLDNKWVKP